MEVDSRKYNLLAKPVIVAPAMNTFMWDVNANIQRRLEVYFCFIFVQSVFTKKHLTQTRELDIIDVDTVVKVLMCNQSGKNAWNLKFYLIVVS